MIQSMMLNMHERRGSGVRLSKVLGLAVLGGVIWGNLGGCYERVVSTNSMGGGADVRDEYRSNTAADRAFDKVFGQPKSKTSRDRWMDAPTE